MRQIRGAFVMLVLLAGCGSEDEKSYSTTPAISFESVAFIQDGAETDSLALTFSYQDDDNDLGLSDEDTDALYNYYIFYTAVGDKLFQLPSLNNPTEFPDTEPGRVFIPGPAPGKLVTLKTREQAGFEYLPNDNFPYSCTNYLRESLFISEAAASLIDASYNIVDTVTIQDEKWYEIGANTDAVYYTINENYTNITVDFLVEQADGTYVEIDWRTYHNDANICRQNFDGRFPILASLGRGTHRAGPFRIRIDSDRAGEITYNLISNGFVELFGLNTKIKLKVSIMDRALHTSNTLETEPFTLSAISR